jgi:hypothetical protein
VVVTKNPGKQQNSAIVARERMTDILRFTDSERCQEAVSTFMRRQGTLGAEVMFGPLFKPITVEALHLAIDQWRSASIMSHFAIAVQSVHIDNAADMLPTVLAEAEKRWNSIYSALTPHLMAQQVILRANNSSRVAIEVRKPNALYSPKERRIALNHHLRGDLTEEDFEIAIACISACASWRAILDHENAVGQSCAKRARPSTASGQA